MQTSLGYLSDSASISTRPPKGRGFYAAHVKRGVDLAALLAFGPVALLLVLAAALAIALSGGSPFYGHERIGRDGRAFRCWKLRTMRPGSDALLAAHLAADPGAAAEWSRRRKLRHDPRITPLGAILRKTSIDELPQLLNVMRGEMTLVGPRPVTAEELARYGKDARAYAQLTPGITGLWQVSGRSRLTFAQRIAFDAEYARRIGPQIDLRILLRTIPAFLEGG